MPIIHLDASDLAILREAFATHLSEQLPDECEADDDPKRLARAEKLAARIERARPGPLKLTRAEAYECGEACDAHLYWEVSDPQDRNDGFVYYDNDHDCSKMKRRRSPAYVARCRAVDMLARRFGAS